MPVVSMHTRFNGVAAFAACVVASTAFAGDPTPPAGPVAPTMKTLDEVEARVPINATNTPGDVVNQYIISNPGSYYLTEDLVAAGPTDVGIKVTAPGVTIDLNGFAIIGYPTMASAGILVQAAGVTIHNGTIRDVGAGYGVDAGLQLSVTVQNVKVLDCGASGTDAAISAGASSLIQNCQVGGGTRGIVVGTHSRVIDCVASGFAKEAFGTLGWTTFDGCQADNSLSGFDLGILSTVSGCLAASLDTTNGVGMLFGDGGMAINSAVQIANRGVVVNAGDVTLDSCHIEQTTNEGVRLEANASATIRDCAAVNTGSGSVVASNANTLILDGMTIRDAGLEGVLVIGGSEAVLRNVTIDTTTGIGVHVQSDRATIEHCTVNGAGTIGIACTNGLIADCSVNQPGSIGISAFSQAVVRNCYVVAPGADGIVLGPFSAAVGNTVRQPVGNGGGHGITAQGEGAVIDGNHINAIVPTPFAGIERGPFNNITIVRNVMVNCFITYTGAPSGTLVGPDDDLTSPWANFTR